MVHQLPLQAPTILRKEEELSLATSTLFVVVPEAIQLNSSSTTAVSPTPIEVSQLRTGWRSGKRSRALRTSPGATSHSLLMVTSRSLKLLPFSSTSAQSGSQNSSVEPLKIRLGPTRCSLLSTMSSLTRLLCLP